MVQSHGLQLKSHESVVLGKTIVENNAMSVIVVRGFDIVNLRSKSQL